MDDRGPAFLFCPGDRPERFGKAAQASDTAVLDLEDGVALAVKDAARQAVVGALESLPPVAVRINHPSTERGRADAASLLEAASAPAILLLPKTESAEEVDGIARLAASRPTSLVATIETARGLMALPDILAHPAVAAVSWGPYDLSADMGMRAVRDTDGRLLSPLLHARDRLLLSAAAAGKAALDTVTTELRDPELLMREATEAATLSFRGKFAIHPSQVGPIRRAFAPPADVLAWAERLLAVVPARGAFLFEGEMIDEPMLRRARRIVESAARARDDDSTTPEGGRRPAEKIM